LRSLLELLDFLLPILSQVCFILAFVYISSLNSVGVFYISVNLSHSENNYIQLKFGARLFQYFVFKKALH